MMALGLLGVFGDVSPVTGLPPEPLNKQKTAHEVITAELFKSPTEIWSDNNAQSKL